MVKTEGITLTEEEETETDEEIELRAKITADKMGKAFDLMAEKLRELITAEVEKTFDAKVQVAAQKIADARITEHTKNSILADQKRISEAVLKAFEIQDEIIKLIKELDAHTTNLLKILELSCEETKALRKSVEKALNEAGHKADKYTS